VVQFVPKQGPRFARATSEIANVVRKKLHAKVFENKTEDQVATQIPFSGEFENPRAGILPALVNLVRNAFVSAFARTLDNTISFRDVGEDVTCLETGDEPGDDCEQREGGEEP